MKSYRQGDLFDQVASLYNEVRPRYPQELFEDLARTTTLAPGAKAIEVGAGTGQATKPMAMRGYEILCVEPGPRLASLLAQEMSNFPNVRILTTWFEDAILPENAFDLVYAATSFHWLKPDAQFTKPFQLLKEGGHLAIIETHHISDGMGDRFFKLSWPIYNRHGFAKEKQTWTPPTADAISPPSIDRSRFHSLFFKKYPLVIEYDALMFDKLLMTYSNHLASDEKTRANFLGEIRQLIRDSFDNAVHKHYVISLTILRKKGNTSMLQKI
jgi:SAM-dependent methyltransferase